MSKTCTVFGIIMLVHFFQPSTPSPTPQEVNMQGNCTWGLITFSCHAKYIVSALDVASKREPAEECLHIIPTYIVPSLIHFLAFAYGFYHFRLAECEQLYSLMERVSLSFVMKVRRNSSCRLQF